MRGEVTTKKQVADFSMNYRMSPTGARFHADDHYVKVIDGPVGSGKTVICCMEIMMRAMRQYRHTDGVRRSRVVVVRDTYINLNNTTLKTWMEWFGNISKLSMSPQISITCKFPLDTEGKDIVELELMFLALDQPGDEKKLLSLEINGVFVNECKTVPYKLIKGLKSRIGRFPGAGKDPDRKTDCYMIMDTNKCDYDDWYYDFAERSHNEDTAIFHQPPAMFETVLPTGWCRYERNTGQRPGIGPAENIENLKEGWKYYEKNTEAGLMCKTDDDIRWMRVYVCAEYGSSESEGKPVFGEYREALHYANGPVSFNPHTPLVLGFDFGLTPSCVFLQRTSTGKLVVLDELVSDDMGINTFLDSFVVPKLQDEYGWGRGTVVYAFCDPAGSSRSQTDASTCIDYITARGINVVECATNNLVPRLEGIRYYLTRLDSNSEPMFLLSQKCEVLHRGFQGSYFYKKKNGAKGFLLVPAKNDYSHVQDALQYAVHFFRNPELYGDIIPQVTSDGFTRSGIDYGESSQTVYNTQSGAGFMI